MDVACPRCATEYEFDEARIPSDGVTVKCTQCSHVFRIKKKASAFTTEVSQPGRDWKLRHADGRIESFQKLTTLHSWIVERRVSRNDEVSLSGETWKRLGDIAELASFFTIVDEAERSRSLRGEVKTQPEGYGAPPPLPKADPMKETLRGGQFPPLAPPAPDQAKTLPPDLSDASTQPQDRPSSGTGKQPAFTPQPPPPPSDATPAPVPIPSEQSLPPPVSMGQPRRVPSRSMRAVSAARQMPDDEVFRARGGGGGAGKWIGLFLLVAGLGLAGGYYLQVYQPQQEALARQRDEEAAARKKADDEKRAEEEKAKKEAEAKALAEADAAKQDAGPAVVDAGAVAVAAVVDAGAPAVLDAGAVAAAPVDAGVKAPVKRDYEQWMALGDRLRAADKAEAAMNAYGEAADLKPDRAEPIAGRGLALLDMGKHLQAEASFDQALKLNPHYGPALMGMAETYRYSGKNDKAIEYYQKYLDVLPEGPESNVAKTQLDRLKKPQ